MSDIPGHGVGSGGAWRLTNQAEVLAEKAYECLDRAAQDASLTETQRDRLSRMKASAKELSDSIGGFLGEFEDRSGP